MKLILNLIRDRHMTLVSRITEHRTQEKTKALVAPESPHIFSEINENFQMYVSGASSRRTERVGTIFWVCKCVKAMACEAHSQVHSGKPFYTHRLEGAADALAEGARCGPVTAQSETIKT